MGDGTVNFNSDELVQCRYIYQLMKVKWLGTGWKQSV